MKKIEKYKNFINENMVNSLLPYLSEDELNKSVDIFEDIYYLTLPFLDKGYGVSFGTAYGRAVSISANDYITKNDKWVEFINGLPVRRCYLEIKIDLNKYDLTELSSIIDDEYGDFLEKIKIYKWVHNKSNIFLCPESTIYRKSLITIEIERK